MSFSSAAVLAVECEGWDLPRVWDGRPVIVSPRELKLLSLSLPKHQLSRAGTSSKQTALERTRAGVPWPAARRGGPSGRRLCSQRCGLHRRRAQVQGALDPDPRRRQETQQGASVPWEGDDLFWVLLLPPLGASRPSPPPLQVNREQVQLPQLLV